MNQTGANMDYAELEDRFLYHYGMWCKETACLSSTTKIVENFHYKEIISMGVAVIPLIVKEMRKEPNHWFHAIDSILGVKVPIPKEMAGKVQELTDHYLKWLEKNGLTASDPFELIDALWKRVMELRGHVDKLLYWASPGEDALDRNVHECSAVTMAAEEAIDKT